MVIQINLLELARVQISLDKVEISLVKGLNLDKVGKVEMASSINSVNQ